MNNQNCTAGAGVIKLTVPYSKPIFKPNASSQAARAQARTITYYKTNLCQRTITQITDWIKSRVSAIRIRNALTPFIRLAAGKASVAVKTRQIEALNDALKAAQSITDGSEKVVSETVKTAMAALDLKEKQGLRDQLNGTHGLCPSVRDLLLHAVTASVQESISSDADFYVLQALDQIVNINQFPLLAEHVVRCVGPYLNGHAQVVSPDDKSLYQSDPLLSPKHQIACLSADTEDKARSWFNGQPKALQQKVADVLGRVVDDNTLCADDAMAGRRRTHAFCVWFQKILLSDPAR